MGDRKRVIVVTDGDSIARRAVETATTNVGGRTISASAGNPTLLTGEEIVGLIHQSQGDPVVVMVDDRGHCREGKGEKALEVIANDPSIELLGVIAVASNTQNQVGTEVDFSITKQGQVVSTPVDKHGLPKERSKKLKGDTVQILNRIECPLIVGLGDPGKMDMCDEVGKGAPVLTEALRQILARSRN